MLREAYICDAIRTPIGRYGGLLSSVRPDDLAAVCLKALQKRHSGVDWHLVDDVILGCANQAGEDNRNVARMSALLSGLPVTVPGTTVNRLCGSGMEAVGQAARAIKVGEADLMIAGGVESMSRAPFVMGKTEAPFSRQCQLYDTTIGWRFINPLIEQQYGVDSMPETAENLAAHYDISREDQDRFALQSQERAAKAQAAGIFAEEIIPVRVVHKKSDYWVEKDESPRETSLEALARLKTPFKNKGCVTAGNASGVNDGACALLLASDTAVKAFNLTPKARVVGMSASGVEPRIMGIGPVSACQNVLQKSHLSLSDMSVIELNEAFASQALAVLRAIGIEEQADFVNPNGGAIALGHPLGMSGARLITTAMYQLSRTGGRYGLCTLCVGVGQGISLIIEQV